MVKNNKVASSMSSTQLLFYNSAINFPMLTVAVFVSGEFQRAREVGPAARLACLAAASAAVCPHRLLHRWIRLASCSSRS